MFTERPPVFVNQVTDEVRGEDKRICWLRRHSRSVTLREPRALEGNPTNACALTFDNRFVAELPGDNGGVAPRCASSFL